MSIVGIFIKFITFLSCFILSFSILYFFLVEAGLLNQKKIKSSPKRCNPLKSRKWTLSENSQLLLKIICLVLVTRLVLSWVGYLGWVYHHRIAPESFLWMFKNMWGGQWDAPHYLFIAENGYIPHVFEKKLLILFPPLYPYLIKTFALIFKNFFWAGFFVSNLFTVISCFFLHKLVCMDFDDSVAFRAVKYVLISPVSFFLTAVYAESLILALIIITIYLLRKEKWFWAGVMGLLASLTKSHGILIMIPMLVEYLLSKNVLKKLLKHEFKSVSQEFLKSGVYIFLPLLGFGLYLLLNKLALNDWFAFKAFLHAERSVRFLMAPLNLQDQWNSILPYLKSQPLLVFNIWIPQILAFLGILGLLHFAIKKIRLSYTIYLFIYLFLSYSVYWMLSGLRYMMIIFPIYIILALLFKKEPLDFLATFIFTALLAIFMVAFTQGLSIL